MVDQPFTPQYGATATIATAAAAVNANLSGASQLLIYNDATGPVFVRVKPSGVAADASITDMPLASKASRVISKDRNNASAAGVVVVSVFSPGGALGNVYVCPGEGYGGI